MKNECKKNDRIVKLQRLLDAHFNGKKDELGKFLGYKDGAFVRQMLSGSRPISEKTVDKINSIKKFKDWFERDDLLSKEVIVTGKGSKKINDVQISHVHHPDIQAVIAIMEGTDDDGKTLIRIKAQEIASERKSFLSRIFSTPSIPTESAHFQPPVPSRKKEKTE